MNALIAPRVPARLVLASIAGLWLCYFVLATVRGWIVGLELHEALLWRRIAVTVASMAVTAALWPILRLLEHRPLWLKSLTILVVAIPASLLLAQINQWVFSDIESQVVAKIGEREGISISRDEAGNVLFELPTPPLPPAPPPPLPAAGPANAVNPPVPPAVQAAAQGGDAAGNTGTSVTIDRETGDENRWRQLTDVALSRYFLLIAWAALYLALVNAEQARVAERREGEYRRAAKAAELRSLRYQVNPHFLFNTLNSLSALVMTGKAQAAETMIQTLSTFYRRSLSDDPTGDLSLAEEIALQKDYLEIEAVRFPERLRTSFDIPDGLVGAQVPGMILQPLIENSVKYGVAASRRAVTISVSAREESGWLVLTVADDSAGGASGSTAEGFGIGLANVRDRLGARFGDQASLETGPVPGGYRTIIRLPLAVAHDSSRP
jgi:two-component system LytT family sensor kinase